MHKENRYKKSEFHYVCIEILSDTYGVDEKVWKFVRDFHIWEFLFSWQLGKDIKHACIVY